MSFPDRIKHSWNAFIGRDPTKSTNYQYGSGNYSRPDRVVITRGSERTILNSVITRLAIDAASIDINHIKLDENGRFKEVIDDSLNRCFTKSANLDQTGRAFKQDFYMTVLDEGCATMVPIDTDIDPDTKSFKIDSMRVGKVRTWFPKAVTVNVYNENDGKKYDITVEKRWTVIVENPFYSIMNERNSTLQRIIRKLNILDVIDNQAGSGKLDMIIQLPYTVKSELAKERMKDRQASIEKQLSENKFGIAYIDSSEHVTQLNRSVENKLMSQIEYLMSMFFSQIGMTQGILDGTAPADTMNNYYNRMVEPLVSEATDEADRKFLTKTARTEGHAIQYFRNPFKMVSVSELPDLMDKLTRNEILSSNECRQIIGLKPSADPEADELRNKNISRPSEEYSQETAYEEQ